MASPEPDRQDARNQPPKLRQHSDTDSVGRGESLVHNVTGVAGLRGLKHENLGFGLADGAMLDSRGTTQNSPGLNVMDLLRNSMRISPRQTRNSSSSCS